jgi:hypothetical protein
MSADHFHNTVYYTSEFEKDPRSKLIEIHSEEQAEDYSCSPAVITDILKTLGHQVTQQDIIEEVRAEIAQTYPGDANMTIEKMGTPPKIMQKVLAAHGVEFEVKESVVDLSDAVKRQSLEFLNEKLDAGCVIICPIQTIPYYNEQRNIQNDGHYVIVCGKTQINGVDNFVVVDPMFHYYQRLSNERGIHRARMGDSTTINTIKMEPEVLYDTVETRDIEYAPAQLEGFDIDPKKYGLRVINADLFIKNWRDVSAEGEKFNQYGIAIKI